MRWSGCNRLWFFARDGQVIASVPPLGIAPRFADSQVPLPLELEAVA